MYAGKIIQDRYELVEPLGEGGMAEVWRARDQRLAREVAIKFLAPQLADDPEFLVRFFSEAQSVARISDRAIVDVLDFGQHEECPYLVMEHVPGGALAELTGQPLLPERAMEIVAEAAAGLTAAHEQGLVHRDIKPGNILLDDRGHVKIADFGIAAAKGAERLTITGAAIGSPHYLSPEQVGGKDATPRSDVYSLGVVLYELLTGRRPFEGENVTAVAIARIDADPEPPSTHNADLAPELDALVLRCMARDPEVRFSSATELAEALRGLRAGASGPTRRAGLGAFTEAGGGPSGGIRFVGVSLAIVLLMGFAGASLLASREPPSPAPPGNDEETTQEPRDESSPEPSETEAAASAGTAPEPPKEKKKKKEKDEEQAEPEEEDGKADVSEPPPTASASPSPSPTPSPEPTATEDSDAQGDEEDPTQEESSDGEGTEEDSPEPSP